MGDPRKLKNKYMTPKKLYDKERIIEENKLKKKYGLRRNKEIWRAKTLLRNFRERARALIAREDEKEKEVLFSKLRDYGLIKEDATLEDVLKLSVEDILSRRLQTIIYKKKMANTPLQARQFIVHGHITVNDIVVRTPSYLVKVGEEDTISFSPGSSLTKMFDIKENNFEGKEGGKKSKGDVKSKNNVSEEENDKNKEKSTESKSNVGKGKEQEKQEGSEVNENKKNENVSTDKGEEDIKNDNLSDGQNKLGDN